MTHIAIDSPYTAQVIEQYSEQWETFVAQYPLSHPLPQDLHLMLDNLVTQCQSETEQLSKLRQFKHLAMAHITHRDLYHEQSIQQSVQQVSQVADATILCAYSMAYQQISQRYGEPMGSYGKQHLYILGMGKLGGNELNFSSDIDLIFAYPETGEFSERRKPFEYQQFFTKVAQKLIYLLDHTTLDGQVWRVDMRLRPLGDSGPLVMPFSAIEEYYQSQGRSWERYAMLKARILNAQDDYSNQLSDILQPFIYRRYVDFSVLDSLREMKRNIAQEYRRRQLSDNIKLGRGGIREVEFLVQCCQLIYGGRHKDLQTASLQNAMQHITEHQILPSSVTSELERDYWILRTVEHRLQQYNNQQTQTLPQDTQHKTILAKQLGFASWAETYEYIQQVSHRIHAHFRLFIQDEDEPNTEQHNAYQDIWELALSVEEMTTICTSIDIALAEQLIHDKNTAKLWQLGERGARILNALCPLFIKPISEYSGREQVPVWCSVFHLLQAVSKRTAYLELMLENHNVREQVLLFCNKSTWVIEQLCQFPVLLDELIHPQYLQHSEYDMAGWRTDYQAQLQHALLRIEPNDVEGQIQALRQFKLAQMLRIAAADILDVLPIAHVSDKLTLLAETILARVVNDAWHHVTARYGMLPNTTEQNTGLVIIGYGKLGGIELSYRSDLDLVCLFDRPKDAVTDGKKSLSAVEFYTKFVQRIMHLMHTKTLLGDLYECDLRLRPSGNSGLLVSSFETFLNYQQTEAWVWEHQALLRARPVYGEMHSCAKFADIRNQILSRPRDAKKLAADVLNMRLKMREHLKAKDKGVMADIEFLTQYWCLANAHQYPNIINYSDNIRQLEALCEANIIPETTAQQLTQSYLTWRHHQHHMSIQRSQVHDDTTLGFLQDAVQKIWRRVFE